jgi:succinate dehydrogenase / fumarate reductase cytochrome b subunit
MNFTNNVSRKKIMAVAGLAWFVYVIFHMLSLLVFHSGHEVFNQFYDWINQLAVYYLLVLALIALLVFHVGSAISRQLRNNASKGQSYKKPYPPAIPRIVAWGGVSALLLFIVFHFVQMKVFATDDMYQYMLTIFSQPLMLLVYLLGLVTLSAHLHHGLSNVLQSLGVSAVNHYRLAFVIVLLIFIGFVSVPMSILL